jgi:hypothetical protein
MLGLGAELNGSEPRRLVGARGDRRAVLLARAELWGYPVGRPRQASCTRLARARPSG